jgi:hypothetical protein
MNYMKIVAIFLLLIIAFSCKKKETGPAPFQWPAGTGEYAPYTIGSTFTYETATTAPAAIDSFTYTVTKDTTIDGLPYKKIESNKPALASTFYCNFTAGVRTEINYNTNFSGINVPSVKLETTKEPIPVNGTWTNTLNVTIPANPPTIPFALPITVTFTYTNMQKDFSKNILGKDYSGTIYTKQVASLPASIVPLLPPNIPASIQVDNYFSKGVGLSQRDGPNMVTKIKRFNVIK